MRTGGLSPEEKGRKGYRRRYRKERDVEVLKGQEDGEIRGNYPTMLNISQRKRGMGGSQGGKDWSREVWTPLRIPPFPPPLPPPPKKKKI